MKKLGGYIFTQITSVNIRKALALYLYVKKKYPTSTIPNFTYKDFSKETGLCFSALKKRIRVLDNLNLLQRVGKENRGLLFKSSKKRHFNVNIDKIDYTSIRTIEDSLCALYIVLIQTRKEYVRQLLTEYEYWRNKPTNFMPKSVNYPKLKKQAQKCGNGKTFIDNGISYYYLANKLKISYTTVSNAIKTGERQKMFTKQRHVHVIRKALVNGHFDIKFLPNNKNVYATDKSIFIIYANTYSLPYESYGMAQ